MKTETVNAIKRNKLIVILRGISADKIIPLAKALYNGGVRVIEVTYETDGSISDSETAEKIKLLCDYFKGKMFIGAGTVLTKKQIAMTKKAGGCLIVSPNTDKKIIKETVKSGLVSIPGAYTPSEITDAYHFGADFVKVFPAAQLGADYFKAVKAPLKGVPLLAVGGITVGNIDNFANAGACGYGISTGIIDKAMLDADDYDGIEKKTREFADRIDSL